MGTGLNWPSSRSSKLTCGPQSCTQQEPDGSPGNDPAETPTQQSEFDLAHRPSLEAVNCEITGLLETSVSY